MKIEWWPSLQERRRLQRMFLRHRHQPWRSRTLPRPWRRQLRLAFWWHCLILLQDEPALFIAALLALPAWLIWAALH